MEFSINQNTLQQALTKIKNCLLSPVFVKIKVGKGLVIASSHDGFSVVIKVANYKSTKEGVVTLDFESFMQAVKGNSEISFISDENQINFKYGRCNGSLNLIEEIKFSHKTLDNFLELDSQSTILFEYLDVMTLKDIKFGQDDAPISIDINSKKKYLELSSATHSEAVLLEKNIKTKSDLNTTLSPRLLKRVKGLVGKADYKIALTGATMGIEFNDKEFNISFLCPLPETSPTTTESIKYLQKKEFEVCKNYLTIDSKDLSDYFSKVKSINEPNNSIEMKITKKGLNCLFTTSKGRIEDTLPSLSKYKTTEDTFLVDYDLLLNNMSKLSEKIEFKFCAKSLWMSIDKAETKVFIMVALL